LIGVLQVIQGLHSYLRNQYAGVLNEEQINRHIKDHIGLEIANQQVDVILKAVSEGGSILDVGSGFGSFVLAARQRGFNAVGIETEPFEVNYARARLSEEMSSADKEKIYFIGSGLELPFKLESFNAVTLWNVLEHVDDYKQLLKECIRVLRPEGFLFVVCPNCIALRREAHYQIFWPPFIPKKLGRLYLKLRGKNPAFFEKCIFYRSNWGVLFTLKKYGLEIFDTRKAKLEELDLISNRKVREAITFLNRNHLSWILHFLMALSFLNPFKNSVFVYARKRN
jgi:SAM-dependent methyltransferase